MWKLQKFTLTEKVCLSLTDFVGLQFFRVNECTEIFAKQMSEAFRAKLRSFRLANFLMCVGFGLPKSILRPVMVLTYWKI